MNLPNEGRGILLGTPRPETRVMEPLTAEIQHPINGSQIVPTLSKQLSDDRAFQHSLVERLLLQAATAEASARAARTMVRARTNLKAGDHSISQGLIRG